jgi:hypothetical protein
MQQGGIHLEVAGARMKVQGMLSSLVLGRCQESAGDTTPMHGRPGQMAGILREYARR